MASTAHSAGCCYHTSAIDNLSLLLETVMWNPSMSLLLLPGNQAKPSMVKPRVPIAKDCTAIAGTNRFCRRDIVGLVNLALFIEWPTKSQIPPSEAQAICGKTLPEDPLETDGCVLKQGGLNNSWFCFWFPAKTNVNRVRSARSKPAPRSTPRFFSANLPSISWAGHGQHKASEARSGWAGVSAQIWALWFVWVQLGVSQVLVCVSIWLWVKINGTVLG